LRSHEGRDRGIWSLGCRRCLGARTGPITVLDLGTQLESGRQAARTAMANTSPDRWSPKDLALVSSAPKARSVGRLPTKQIYGSNFVFENSGQLDGIDADGEANRLVVSGPTAASQTRGGTADAVLDRDVSDMAHLTCENGTALPRKSSGRFRIRASPTTSRSPFR
jgi:hypothetical protein